MDFSGGDAVNRARRSVRLRTFSRRVGLGGLSGDAAAVAAGHLSSFIYPLVSIPFLARVLGTEHLGKLIFALAIIQVVVYVVDYGFGMSALRRISLTTSPDERAPIVSATLVAKLLLYVACVAVLVPLVFLIPGLRPWWTLYLIGLALVLGNIAFPEWLLQGLGKMKTFAVLTAVSRIVALGGLLLTVDSTDDVKTAMFWQLIPMSISAVVCWTYLVKKRQAKLARPSRNSVFVALRDGWPLFVSMLSTMVIGTANTIVLGALSTLHQVAYFGTAERMSNAARGVLGGVQEAMLPRMTTAMEDPDGKTLRRTIAVGILGCFATAGIMLIVFADVLIPWYLGHGFDGAIPMAQLLGVALCLTGITAAYTLTLVARHRFNTISRIMVTTAVVHLVVLPIGCLLGGGIGAAAAIVVTEAAMVGMFTRDHLKQKRSAPPAGAGQASGPERIRLTEAP